MNILFLCISLLTVTICTVNAQYCPGEQACFSSSYYWCCSNSDTCGSFRTCDNNIGDTLKTVGYVMLCISFLISCCGYCIRRHRQNKNPTPNPIIPPARNQGVVVQGNSMRNAMSTPVRLDPIPLYTVAMPTATSPISMEDAPPVYAAVVSPSLAQEQSNV